MFNTLIGKKNQYFSFQVQFHNGVSVFVSENHRVTLKGGTMGTIRISKLLIQQWFKIPCYCLPVPSVNYMPIPN